MFLCLVQHAEPKSKEEDPERTLSERGLKEIRRVSSHVSRFELTIHEIFHSGKLRAKQTAEVLSEDLNPAKGVFETDGLAPLDEPSLWMDRLKGMDENIMLVGHLPHLDKFSSLLLCGDMDRRVVTFRMGGVLCLKRESDGNWALQWMVIPEMVL
jgi:phosphohistidine phosphatase